MKTDSLKFSGILSLVIGIITITVAIPLGVLSIINGVKLMLFRKKHTSEKK